MIEVGLLLVVKLLALFYQYAFQIGRFLVAVPRRRRAGVPTVPVALIAGDAERRDCHRNAGKSNSPFQSSGGASKLESEIIERVAECIGCANGGATIGRRIFADVATEVSRELSDSGTTRSATNSTAVAATMEPSSSGDSLCCNGRKCC